MRSFESLTPQEIVALAISSEEEDARIYGDFAENLKTDFPGTAKIFLEMQLEEERHAAQLKEMFHSKYGEHIPLVRREDVKGFVKKKPVWLFKPLRLEAVRRQASDMELQAQQFYEQAAKRNKDPEVAALLRALAEAEKDHEHLAARLEAEHLTPESRELEASARHRLFVLQVVQPGLAGLMDGSVSTLAPLFAAAFATHNSTDALLVGLAASVGAAISMGFAEALSDDGTLTGRGHPWMRGAVCGAMTTAGGLGHTIPYFIPHFGIATCLAILVVLIELAAISWIRHRYMETPLKTAAFQVVLGGILVFIAGVVIGNS